MYSYDRLKNNGCYCWQCLYFCVSLCACYEFVFAAWERRGTTGNDGERRGTTGNDVEFLCTNIIFPIGIQYPASRSNFDENIIVLLCYCSLGFLVKLLKRVTLASNISDTLDTKCRYPSFRFPICSNFF